MSIEVRNVSQLTHKLRRLPLAVREAAVEEIQAAGVRIRDQARRNAPIQQGDLRQSIKKRRAARGLDARIGTSLFYGRFIEFGTKQHVIQNKKGGGKRVLYSGWSVSLATRGASGGFGPVSGKVVHPGIPARPFLLPAAEEERAVFPRKLARRINVALGKVAAR